MSSFVGHPVQDTIKVYCLLGHPVQDKMEVYRRVRFYKSPCGTQKLKLIVYWDNLSKMK